MPEAFYATAFRKKIYRTPTELQADWDAWLHSYNYERPHPAGRDYEKTPIQTFSDSIKSAHEKQLDHLTLSPSF